MPMRRAPVKCVSVLIGWSDQRWLVTLLAFMRRLPVPAFRIVETS
jgi:hypothetical protein